MTLYRFVDAQKAEGFPVRLVCSVVGVSPSAYYAHKQQPGSDPAKMAEAALVDEIRAIWADSDGTYGSPRVCAALRRRGRVVNHKRVERLMKGHHIVGFGPRKRRVTTTPPLLIGSLTCWRATSALPGLMKPGWAISPTSEPAKDSSTWRSSWTWRPAEWSVSPWRHT